MNVQIFDCYALCSESLLSVKREYGSGENNRILVVFQAYWVAICLCKQKSEAFLPRIIITFEKTLIAKNTDN